MSIQVLRYGVLTLLPVSLLFLSLCFKVILLPFFYSPFIVLLRSLCLLFDVLLLLFHCMSVTLEQGCEIKHENMGIPMKEVFRGNFTKGNLSQQSVT